VEVFSVGFGKRLFGRKWRGTDYRVSAIPLGGLRSRDRPRPDESTIAEGSSREAATVGRRWQRALILLAGPTMNVALAWLLHSAVFAIGTRVPAYELQPPIVRVVQPGSPGEEAGFQPGDRIRSIDGEETARWRDAEFLFAMNARQKLDVEVERAGQRLSMSVTPRPSPSTTSARGSLSRGAAGAADRAGGRGRSGGESGPARRGRDRLDRRPIGGAARRTTYSRR
jgi:regulator of sigma E protease